MSIMLRTMAVLVAALVASADPPVQNFAFEDGLTHWQKRPDTLDARVLQVDGHTVAQLTIPEAETPGYPCLYQNLTASPGDLLTASTRARGLNVRKGNGVYLAIEFFDANDTRLSFSQSGMAPKDGTWTPLTVQGVMPPDAASARLCLLLNGTGIAEFEAIDARREPGVLATAPPAGPVIITITDEVACPALRGFGAEDDGWFYNPDNAAHGVMPEDAVLRESRIASMDPDWVRMFFWYKDWNPSGDWETFTFDSPNMESHYRTLDVYQRLGTSVNVVGVEWGVNDPYGDPARAAKAIGALFEHLIKAKGYTCVQDWTLTNEPNGYFINAGYDFRRFVELHELVRKEFDARGLAVRIVGSDETNGGFSFFQQCVEDDRYFGLADYYASHRYFPYADRVTAPSFFDERLALLAKRTPRKDLVIAEFGFQDQRSGTVDNPLMESYPYAVWTAAFVIEGLNRGVAGFSIWCLQEVHYPGTLMNYGLWDFKDNGWKLRPVYYAWLPFSRYTEPGDQVLRCTSSSPAHVIAAMVGHALFWVNRSEFPVEMQVEAWPGGAANGSHPVIHSIMTESTLPEKPEDETLLLTNRLSIQAPPMSFGYIRVAHREGM